MHIGFYCHGWPANEYPDGIAAYVYNLREELISLGHRVSVFCSALGRTNSDPGIYVIEASLKYKITRKLSLSLQKKPHAVFLWGRAIAAKVNEVHRTDPIDILEMEESFGWCADVQRLVPFPLVVKLHGPAFISLVEEELQTDIAAPRIEMEGKALQQMDVIISPSKSTLAATVTRYGLKPHLAKVIPNPITPNAYLKYWERTECDSKTILFVGRFDKRKGGDTALFAFRRLLETDKSLRMIFVGPDRGLTAAGRLPIFFDEFMNSNFTEAQRPSIQYLGQIPRTNIFDLRTKAMLTIVVSRWENQPNTVLEAMIQGCPIVASDTGGVSELIENEVTGLLARANDVQDLCEKILFLLNNPVKAAQMGATARQFAARWHLPRALATDTVSVYQDAISIAKFEERKC